MQNLPKIWLLPHVAKINTVGSVTTPGQFRVGHWSLVHTLTRAPFEDRKYFHTAAGTVGHWSAVS